MKKLLLFCLAAHIFVPTSVSVLFALSYVPLDKVKLYLLEVEFFLKNFPQHYPYLSYIFEEKHPWLDSSAADIYFPELNPMIVVFLVWAVGVRPRSRKRLAGRRCSHGVGHGDCMADAEDFDRHERNDVGEDLFHAQDLHLRTDRSSPRAVLLDGHSPVGDTFVDLAECEPQRE